MKLIVDIPEEVYKSIQDNDYCGILNSDMYNVVKNGTPLDKIRAEIEQKQYDFMADTDYCNGVRFGLMLAYQITDKYKAESEDKK